MKAFIVVFDNGLDWCDHTEWNAGVYATLAEAVKAAKALPPKDNWCFRRIEEWDGPEKMCAHGLDGLVEL